MSTRVNIDGRIVEPEDARIPVFDHGFLYGDAVYEVLRTYEGRPLFLDRNFARLERSAAGVALTIPWDLLRLGDEVRRTLEAAGNPESMVRIIVTRGVGDLNPDPEECRTPAMVLIVFPLWLPSEEAYRDGAAVTLSNLRRDPEIAMIKSGSLIHQVLGARAARTAGAIEAIMQTPEGNLSDGTRSNVFLVRNGEILTPSGDACIVWGIHRNIVLEIVDKLGIQLVEGKFSPAIISECDEMFLTSTAKGLLPITRVDDSLVGDGKVGPITRRVGQAFGEELSRLIAEDRRRQNP